MNNTKLSLFFPGMLMMAPFLSIQGHAAPSAAGEVRIERLPGGEYRCVTDAYSAQFDKAGNLQTLTSGGTELLARPGRAECGAGFVQNGRVLPFRSVRQVGADTLVAEGEPGPKPGDPVVIRATYQFRPDHFTVKLEQQFELYGGFAWFPSAAVIASRDAQTDHAQRMDAPISYGQMDPRLITRDGPILRFDFGVWQRGFANAAWRENDEGGKKYRYLVNTVVRNTPLTVTVFPLAHPTPADALTFDITAASPDFDMPGGKPVQFEIATGNAGPDPIRADVRFSIRDYLTKATVGSRTTTLTLSPRQSAALPTDLVLKEPGPYRGVIEVLDGKQVTRTVEWIFSYDFAQYNPPLTRPADFAAFWKKALAESAALPLDVKKTPAPEKSTATMNACRLNFATLGGRRIYGWYTCPKSPGRYPARVRFPSSGIYPIENPEFVEGQCTLWITITGFDVDLSNMPKGDDPGKNYWTAGIQSPETSMWRTIYVSLVRAVDVMQAQPEVNPARLYVYGGSQGGGLAMVAAALDHRVGLCIPTYSGLARLDWTVRYAPGYWPFDMSAKPAGQSEEQFLHTLSYFDTANFTPDIRCPVLAEVGLMDTVTASGNQLAALAHVPRPQLYLVCAPWGGHATGSRPGDHIWEYCQRFVNGITPVIPPPPADPSRTKPWKSSQ